MRKAIFLTLAVTACSGGMTGGGTGGGGQGGGTSGSGGGGAQQQSLTWYKDVLPVAQARCMSCHQSGGIAPFAMTDTTAVSANAAAMAADVSSRKMPPWQVEEACGGPFAGSLHLSDDEMKLFNDWVNGGAVIGNSSDAPAAFVPPAGLTTVDLNKSPPNPYTPPENVTDDYHCFVLDPGLSAAKSVVAYEIDPGVVPEVHHVVLYMVDRAQALAKDPNGTGWTCFGGTGTNDQNLMGAWAPGSRAVTFPAGTGITLDPGKVIVMQLHYNLQNGVRQPDTTALKLQFATGSVTPAQMQFLIDSSFNIPPNAMGYQHSATFTLPAATKLWGAFGHMHTQGHIVTLKTPSDCLLDIPNWDFHWQEQYFYMQPKQLAAGDKITLSCTWNNTTGSALHWGEDTGSEMCVAAIYVTQ